MNLNEVSSNNLNGPKTYPINNVLTEKTAENPFNATDLQPYELPNDVLNIIFKKCGPSLLNLSRVTVAFQQSLQKNDDFQDQKIALELLKNAYRLDKINQSVDSTILTEVVSALTLIDPEQALKITNNINIEKFSSNKYKALLAISRALITKNHQEEVLEILDLAIEAIPMGYGQTEYTRMLKPIIKMLIKLKPEKALKIANENLENEKDFLDFLRKTEYLSRAVISTHPQDALNMLEKALTQLNDNPVYEWEFVPLLKSLAQITPKKALKATETLKDKYVNYVLSAIIKALAPDKQALEIAESATMEGYKKFRCLAERAVALSFCDSVKASAVCSLAIAEARESIDLIGVAQILAKTNPKKSYEALIKAYNKTIIDLEKYGRWDYLECIVKIFSSLNLNDSESITLLEKVLSSCNSIPPISGSVSSTNYVTSAIAIAFVPINFRRTLEIIDTIKDPYCLAKTCAEVAQKVFTNRY